MASADSNRQRATTSALSALADWRIPANAGPNASSCARASSARIKARDSIRRPGQLIEGQRIRISHTNVNERLRYRRFVIAWACKLAHFENHIGLKDRLATRSTEEHHVRIT